MRGSGPNSNSAKFSFQFDISFPHEWVYESNFIAAVFILGNKYFKED